MTSSQANSNVIIPTNQWYNHICTGNPCTICGGQTWNGSNTYTYNMVQCDKCGTLYFSGCLHQCAGMELAALKLELERVKAEAEELKKTVQRYKDLLEEFKLAIQAEQE